MNNDNRFCILSNAEAFELVGDKMIADPDYGWCVVEFPPNSKPRIIGYDGGAPEDQSLVRDWSWVADALNSAYEQGLDDGREVGYDDGHDAGYDEGYENGSSDARDHYED